MPLFLLYSKNNLLNRKGLSDASVVLLIKEEYGSAVHFLYTLAKSLLLKFD